MQNIVVKILLRGVNGLKVGCLTVGRWLPYIWVMKFQMSHRQTMQPSVITHMVVLGQQIKFRGTIAQCYAKKKELAKIHGYYALKVIPIQ